MKKSFLKQHFASGLVIGLIISLLLLGKKFILIQNYDLQDAFSYLLIPVMISALYGGRRAGIIIATTVAILAAGLFVFPNTPTSRDIVSFILYSFQAVMVLSIINLLTQRGLALVEAEEDEKEAKRVAEKRLRDIEQSQRRFQRLVDSNIVGIMFWNKAGDVLEANPVMLKMLGYNENELLNGKITHKGINFPEYDKVNNKALKEMEEKGVSLASEKEYLRKDGKRVSVIAQHAFLEDDPDEGVTFAIDMSEMDRQLHKK